MEVGTPVFVTGVIRSGTTWLGRLLATAQNAVYLHEPFNPHSPWNAACPLPNQYVYLDGANGELYVDLARELTSLRPVFRNRKWAAGLVAAREAELQSACSAAEPGVPLRAIIKDPTAVFSSEWLVQHCNVQPVFVLRHPVYLVQSLVQLGWAETTVFGPLRKQSRLLQRFYAGTPVIDELAALPDPDLEPVDRAALFVRCIYYAVWRLLSDHPQWLVVRHEELAGDTSAVLSGLMQSLDLQPTTATAAAVAPTEKAPYQAKVQDQDTLAPIPLAARRAAFAGLDHIDWSEVHERYFADLFRKRFPVADYGQWPAR